ncbi:MAG: FAD-binding protein [Bacilli bacterium]|nr:FAD-binding protein [Bacilli bacterium]
MSKICVFDVVIIGSGPSGLSVAVELSKTTSLSIAVLDKGNNSHSRKCPARSTGVCAKCTNCSVLSGFGGASGTLGGKLCFFPAGLRLSKALEETPAYSNDRVKQILKRYRFNKLNHSSSMNYDYGEVIQREYQAIPVLENDMVKLFNKMLTEAQSQGVKFIDNFEVCSVEQSPNYAKFKVFGTVNNNNVVVFARDALIIATGRSGATTTQKIIRDIGIKTSHTSVDVGVRIEMNSTSDNKAFSPHSQDPKIIMKHNTEEEVRTLCWTRHGDITLTRFGGVTLVDGHFGNSFSNKTSVSIVSRVQVDKSEFPLDIALDLISSKSKSLPIVQDLKSFIENRSNQSNTQSGMRIHANQDNIRKHMDVTIYRQLIEFIHRLFDLTNLKPVLDQDANVLFPVIDKFWSSPILDKHLMSSIDSVYFVGDATGRARGIIQAIRSGAAVAERIACLTNNNSLLADNHGLSLAKC